MDANKLKRKQKALLGKEAFYKAQLIFNVEREPEVMMSVRITSSLRDEIREFCRQHNIQQQQFIIEAAKEVLSRLKSELEASSGLEAARKQARGEA